MMIDSASAVLARGRHAWFPREEYEARTAALRVVLARDDLDAVVLTDPLNVAYVSGLVTPAFGLRSRPAAVLLPREGDPILVLARPHIPQAEAVTWIDRFIGFEGFEPAFVTATAAALGDLCQGSGRVGYEGSQEHRPAVTVDGYRALRDESGVARWQDVSSALWKVRQIKSPREVAYLRTVGAATGAAFDAVQDTLRAGMTEEDVYRVFARTIVDECGGTVGYFAMHSGVNERFRSNGWPTQRVIDEGDLVWLDVGAVHRGYWSDFTRMFAVGRATQGQRDCYAQMYAANRHLVSELRAGVTADHLMAVCTEWFRNQDLGIANAARIGHGIGTSITEPPSVITGDGTVLEAGTALALEPAIRTEEGYFVVEENLLVGEDGCEFLSAPCPPELPVV